jgi:hypothetical protein
MGRRSVTCVSLPAEPRVPSSQALHQLVAEHLGQDAGAGNGVALRVAIHDRSVLEPEVLHGEAVDQEKIVGLSEPANRPANREGGRGGDVESIDLAHARGTERPRDGTGPDKWSEAHSLCGGELLGVSHARDRAGIGRHHEHTSDNGAREGAPSDFIGSGDQPAALLSKVLFYRRPARHYCKL